VDKSEAKRRLLSYRGGRSENDPEVEEALAVARQDPELEEWLAKQSSFHGGISRELRGIPVPAHLKAAILKEQIIIPFWRRAEFLLAAACLVLGLLLSAFWFGPAGEDQSFAGFRSRMVAFALREYRMDILTNDPAQIREYLRTHGAPADYSIPPTLGTTPEIGGARLSWQAKPVAMVCFKGSGKQTSFMFVLDQRAFDQGPLPGPNPERRSVRGVMTSSWIQDGRAYLLFSGEVPAPVAPAPSR
jgi:hypothetical protein